MICDCPGLVFPQVSFSKAHMVCNGVLPIDQIRDFYSPMELIVKWIPKKVFEHVYRIKIDYKHAYLPSKDLALDTYAIFRK